MPDSTPGPPSDPTPETRAKLVRAQDQFVASWGRMGSVWGISRTMAEVHALLYITGEPMCTDAIMERLGVSRGNVSMSVRALLDWRVIDKVRVQGDRKEYFQAELDVWSMLRAIAHQRIKREVTPMIESLDEIAELAPLTPPEPSEDEIRELHERIDAVREGFELISTLADKFAGPSGPGLQTAARLLARAPVGNRRPRPRTRHEGPPREDRV